MNNLNSEISARLTAEVLVAYLGGNSISAAELPEMARRLREALEVNVLSSDADARPTPRTRNVQEGVGAAQETAMQADAPVPEGRLRLVQAGPAEPQPIATMTPAESITDDYLISFEDGKHYRSLRRHLMAKYGLTPDAYRSKWNLPADYPMVAPSYAKSRSEVAKRSGLGRSGSAKGSSRSKRA